MSPPRAPMKRAAAAGKIWSRSAAGSSRSVARAATAERVAQRVHEDLRRCLLRRGVERCQTERFPEVSAQAAVLAMAVEQAATVQSSPIR
jgi:hypothetical protein